MNRGQCMTGQKKYLEKYAVWRDFRFERKVKKVRDLQIIVESSIMDENK